MIKTVPTLKCELIRKIATMIPLKPFIVLGAQPSQLIRNVNVLILVILTNQMVD